MIQVVIQKVLVLLQLQTIEQMLLSLWTINPCIWTYAPFNCLVLPHGCLGQDTLLLCVLANSQSLYQVLIIGYSNLHNNLHSRYIPVGGAACYSRRTQVQTGSHLSIKARNLCLYVCVCLKYLCGSGSDWPESFNMAAAWFSGVQLSICLDCNDTVNKLFHKCFTNSASIVHRSHHSHVRTRANHCRAQAHDIL